MNSPVSDSNLDSNQRSLVSCCHSFSCIYIFLAFKFNIIKAYYNYFPFLFQKSESNPVIMHRGSLGEADKFFVYLDGQAVVKTTSFVDAVLSLLTVLHVFELQYPPYTEPVCFIHLISVFWLHTVCV